jgi:RNA polymerase sigma-70 factor (ECF subfamily)
MSTETHSTLRTRASLLFRLRDWEDQASWSEFDQLYRNYVKGQALRAGLSRSECDDLVQDVFKRVAETIHQFDARPDRGSFRRWLITLVRWRITDKFRERDKAQWADGAPSATDTGEQTATIDRVPDINAQTDIDATEEEEWQKHVLDAAFDRLSKKAKAKQFQVFELYARHQWPVSRISKELGINLASVYVINHRLTKLLKLEVDRLRTELG